jgi:hypothetical protein
MIAARAILVWHTVLKATLGTVIGAGAGVARHYL